MGHQVGESEGQVLGFEVIRFRGLGFGVQGDIGVL